MAPEALYDDAPPEEQAKIRARWREQITERIASLNFADELRASGTPWSEADAAGRVVTRHPLSDHPS